MTPVDLEASELRRPRSQAIASALLLLIGFVGGSLLLRSALATPIPGSPPSGSDLAPLESSPLPQRADAVAVDGPSSLVLYEGPDPDSELAAIALTNLAGHFGPVTARSVFDYHRGDGALYDGVIFVGIYGNNDLPDAFLADVINEEVTVLWLGSGISQLTRNKQNYFLDHGWIPAGTPSEDPATVTYKETQFDRDSQASLTYTVTITDPANVLVLATARGLAGPTMPWAIRSQNVTYVSEVPFDYLTEGNHSLIVADLLFDLLDPERPERHRALVRLEDVGPYADPETLRLIGDALESRGIPFSVAVYTLWRDPKSQYEWGTDIRMVDRPETVEALKYLESKGGTLIMHGVTHQYGDSPNPYFGTSGEDLEFFTAHVDDHDDVILDGPVPVDSARWATDRVHQGFAEMAAAGLDPPTIFEFPHYSGSPSSYQAIASIFDARYGQGTYYPGLLSDSEVDVGKPQTQFFPYPVLDAYGEYVIPENLGNIIPVGFNNHSARWPDDLVHSAENTLVVRDGVASFFFHPYLDLQYLLDTIDGMQDLGYEFVAPNDLLEEWS